MINKAKNLPYHFLVIAILPVISLYAHNIEQVSFKNTLRAYFVFLFVAMFGFLILFLVIRKIHPAALVISYGLILFYSVIPFQTVLINIHAEGFSRLRYLLPIFAVVFFAGVFVGIKKIQNPGRLTGMFNVIALSTLILPIFEVSSFVSLNVVHAKSSATIEQNLSNKIDTQSLPDVYLIVLDTHGRSDEIKREFGYDNSQAIDKLTEMGFYVAQCSNANYPTATWQSIYATLNMRYFEHEEVKRQNPQQTLSNGFYQIKNNEVLTILKQHGYTFVNFNTMYDFLNFTDADVYYDLVEFPGTNIRSFNKFESLLLDETPVGPFVDESRSGNQVHYENVRQILKKLPQIPQGISSPKFVYAHIMVPHFPYVFSPDGEYLAEGQDEFTPQKFAGQVAFIDQQVTMIARQLIAHSITPPVIVIQGDHGYSSAGILNAYYLPGIDYAKQLYPTISPVNSFRLIFSLFFAKNMSLLSDKTYRDNLGSDKEHRNANVPYDFMEYISNDHCSD